MGTYEYEIYPELGLCVFVARGTVEIADFKQTGNRMLSDERWVTGGNFLLDFRRARVTELAYGRMQTAVDKDRSFDDLVGSGKAAWVADTKLMYGFGRMWQIMSEERPLDIGVFWELEDGLAFLGVEEPISWRGCPLEDV